MRTSRSEFDIRKDFGFYDLGFTAAVGVHRVAIYELLRRFVWRKGRSYDAGRLVTTVSQSKLAKLSGMSRSGVNSAVATLREIGWIYTEGEREALVYILGEVSENKAGHSESFYADAMCARIADEAKELAEKMEIPKLQIDDMLEFVTGRLKLKKGVTLVQKADKGHVVSDDKHVVSDDNPCRLKEQGLSFQTTEEVENRETAKQEEEKKEVHNPSGCGSPAGMKGEEGEAKADSPAFGEALLKRDPAPMTHRVKGEGVGTPRPLATTIFAAHETPGVDRVPDHVVPLVRLTVAERNEKAKAKAEAALAGFKAARTAKDRKRSLRDQKLKNLGGKGAADDPAMKRLLTKLERSWRRAFTANFPDTPLAQWAGRERGQVIMLVEKYNGEIAEEGLLYVAKNWEVISSRFKKAPQVPTPGWLLSLHDSLIPEASKFGKVVGVLEEWNAWWREHPEESPPPLLKKRFEAGRKELESLGLI